MGIFTNNVPQAPYYLGGPHTSGAPLPDGSPLVRPSTGGGDALTTLGFVASTAGTLMQAIGTYYAAKSQQFQLKSQQLSMEHAEAMANINARSAELEAQSILEAGQQAAAMSSMRYGQVKAEQRTSAAARGIVGNVGSQAEVQASIEYAKRTEALTINVNAVRQANAARAQAQNQRNQGMLARVSGLNLGATASSINPAVQANSSLMQSAGNVANQWATNRRISAYLASRAS